MIVHLPHRPSAALRRLIASRHDDGGEPLQQRWIGVGGLARLSVTRADGTELSATEQAHVRAAIAALGGDR
jgi:hypothetical protein